MISVLAMAGISAVLEAGEAYMQIEAAQAAAAAEESSVRTQELSNQYKIETQKGKTLDKELSILYENEALQTKRGLALNSPSFNAMQIDTVNKARGAISADTTFEKVNTLSAEAKKDALREQLQYKEIGTTVGTLADITGTVTQGEYLYKYGGLDGRKSKFPTL